MASPLNPGLPSCVEIRFSREQQRLYQEEEIRIGAIPYGGEPPEGNVADWPNCRDWAVGLLAMCLFDIFHDDYTGLIDGLDYLTSIPDHIISDFLTELVGQIAMLQIFEESSA